MSNPIIKIVNAITGEQIERQMNAEELEQWEADKARRQALASEQAAKEAARQAALDKLAAIGLTTEEIQALVGN